MLAINQLFVYPIKGLGGIPLQSAEVTERGFAYDRRWMLIDGNNVFITQRDIPGLALLQVKITEEGLEVSHKHAGESVMVPFIPASIERVTVTIWDDVCTAQLVSVAMDKWFSGILRFSCRLVYMPDDIQRRVDINYASNNEITGFSDGFPFLLIGQSSLDDLNKRLTTPLGIERFRPNIVFTGGAPFEEDILEHFTINDIAFYGVKLCARCTVTTINQQTAEKGKEPLKTLATFRSRNNNVYFGQNLLHHGTGKISVGDLIVVKKRKEHQPMEVKFTDQG